MTIDKRLMQPKLHSFRDRVAGRLIQKQSPPGPADGTTISNTPNLMMWYKADAMGYNPQSGSDVTSWADSSGNGLTLYPHTRTDIFTSYYWQVPITTGSSIGTYLTPKWYSNQVNGKPLVRYSVITSPQEGNEWSGLSSGIEAPQSTSTTGYSMFMVFRRMTSYGFENIPQVITLHEKARLGYRASNPNSVWMSVQNWTANNWGAYCGEYVHPNWAVWGAKVGTVDNRATGYKNGVWTAISGLVPEFMDFGRPRVTIGLCGYYSMCDVAEAIVYGRELSHNEMVSISTELMTKYGISA
jgi:hypothetical protein